MSPMNWFRNLRFSNKLIVLLLPCILSFLGLGVWNSYSNNVADQVKIQVDTAYQLRGETMTSALVALHYGEAVKNQIPDSIRLKRSELKQSRENLDGFATWVSSQNNDPLKQSYVALGQQISRIVELPPNPEEGISDEAALLGDLANDFKKLQQSHIDLITAHYKQTRNKLEWMNGIVITVGVLLLLAMLVIILRVVLNPLNEMSGLVNAIATGDLTKRIESTSKDEIGRLLQALMNMEQSLAFVVRKVRDNSELITTSSQEIAEGNMNLSERTEEQAASLEQTAATMKEFVSSVRQNAENAEQANKLAMNASDVALKGGRTVGEVVATMTTISDSSRKIQDIISVIEGIAFQTNILALNAAVEAARAGEQGRGFAVVAGEVRNLAQRSAAAAKEITTLIKTSVAKVEDGTRQADLAGKTMNEIVEAVKRVTDIMSEISAASAEQKSGIDQVNDAISQMDDVTQQNAALVEEAAAAAAAMREQSVALMESVSVFKLEFETSISPSASTFPVKAEKLVTKSGRTNRVQPQLAHDKDEWHEY